VQRSSVSRMVQKLDDKQYLIYEKHRGFILTSEGNRLGEWYVYRNQMLKRFLETVGISEYHIDQEVEGIEHHFSADSVKRIAGMIKYFDENMDRVTRLREIQYSESNDIDN